MYGKPFIIWTENEKLYYGKCVLYEEIIRENKALTQIF